MEPLTFTALFLDRKANDLFESFRKRTDYPNADKARWAGWSLRVDMEKQEIKIAVDIEIKGEFEGPLTEVLWSKDLQTAGEGKDG